MSMSTTSFNVPTWPSPAVQAWVASNPFIPKMTFGVEIEFIYACRRELLRRFAAATGQDPVFVNDRISDATRLFLLRKLTRTLPSGPPIPRHIPDMKITQGNTDSDFNIWNLGDDASLGADWREVIPQMQGLNPVTEKVEDWHWMAAELSSQIFNVTDDQIWFPQLMQVQEELTPNQDQGGYANRASNAGLHVHVAFLPPSPVPADLFGPNSYYEPAYEPGKPPRFQNGHMDLETIKNIIILWAANEEFFDQFHPSHRRGSTAFARSLRSMQITPWDLIQFADRVYKCNSIHELSRVVYGPGFIDRANFRVAISLPRPNKIMTLEFREHRGTFNAVEIGWWVKFIECFVKTAHRLTGYGFKLESLNDNVLEEDLFVLIGFPDAGQKYFESKKSHWAKNEEPEGFISSDEESS